MIIKEQQMEEIERLRLYEVLTLYVSDEEQAEIEADFGSPGDYKDDEVVDLTNWVEHGGEISQDGVSGRCPPYRLPSSLTLCALCAGAVHYSL